MFFGNADLRSGWILDWGECPSKNDTTALPCARGRNGFGGKKNARRPLRNTITQQTDDAALLYVVELRAERTIYFVEISSPPRFVRPRRLSRSTNRHALSNERVVVCKGKQESVGGSYVVFFAQVDIYLVWIFFFFVYRTRLLKN